MALKLNAPAAAGDNLLFLRLRWILLLWMSADLAVHWDGGSPSTYSVVGLLAGFTVSQGVLWKLPATYLRGMKLYTLIFLLDLFFMVSTLIALGQADSGLLMVTFLTIFVTALVQRLSLAAIVSLVSTGIYLAFRLQGRESFAFDDMRQMLDIPFIVLASLHAAIIVSEAQFHQEISDALENDNQHLSKRLGNTALELKARVRFINGAFDAVPAPALVLDGDGVVRSFNTRAEELFQIRRRAVLDHAIKDLAFLEPLRQILRQTGPDGNMQGSWLLTGKNERFYGSVRSGVARDEDGKLLNMAVFVQPAEAPPEPEHGGRPFIDEPAAPAPAATLPTIPAPAVPAGPPKVPGATSSSLVQRSLAAGFDDEPKKHDLLP